MLPSAYSSSILSVNYSLHCLYALYGLLLPMNEITFAVFSVAFVKSGSQMIGSDSLNVLLESIVEHGRSFLIFIEEKKITMSCLS